MHEREWDVNSGPYACLSQMRSLSRDLAITTAKLVEHPERLAARPARRRCDREQEVVELNSKRPCGMSETNQESLEVIVYP